jgi:hypothetical protein
MRFGFAWDVWPCDTGQPRIAVGHAMDLGQARKMVEKVLAADDSAIAGTVDQPFTARWLCRRGRAPGTFVWLDATSTAAAS